MGALNVFPGRGLARLRRPCASRASIGTLGQSNGSDTVQTSRIKVVATADCCNLTFSFGNFAVEPASGNGAAHAGTDALSVRCSIEPTLGLTGGGTPLPIYFGSGSRTASLAPGALMESRPVGIFLSKGDSLWVRTSVTVGSGGKWWCTHHAAYSGEAINIGTDNVDSGTIDSSAGYAYGPMLIRGEVAPGTICVAGIGDSIMLGKNEDTLYYDNGAGALARAIGTSFPYIHLANDGERTIEFKTITALLARGTMLQGCTHAVVNFGINDLIGNNSFATIQANLLTIWATLKDRYGIRDIRQATLGPYTDTTGATLPADQTIQLSAPREADRLALNDYFRTVPAPLSGYVEFADAIESARGSGKWKTGNLTAEGLHPSALGYAAQAAAIDIGVFH